MKKIMCKIESVDKLNHDVYQVKLSMPAGSEKITYLAGQYLDLFLPNGKSASFSIGSAPEAGLQLELHIRHNPESEMSNALIEHLLAEKSIEAEVGKGDAAIQADQLNSEDTVILAAASTGFSQVKSVVEHLLAQGASNQIHIYWVYEWPVICTGHYYLSSGRVNTPISSSIPSSVILPMPASGQVVLTYCRLLYYKTLAALIRLRC